MSDPYPESKKSAGSQAPTPAVNFLLMSAGSIFTSMIAAGFIVGYALDQLFETTPILLLLCGLLGFIGGTQKVMRLSSRLDQVADEVKKDEKS